MLHPIKLAAAMPPGRRRLAPRERRRQIVRVASALVATRGVDHVRMPEVARAAGVTRAIVYKFFRDRRALLAAVLDDFCAELGARYQARAALLRAPIAIDATVRGFAEASCDALDAAGAGGGGLLNMDGPDVALAVTARTARAALHRPWLRRVARYTGAGRATAAVLSEMLIATSRAVLAMYVARSITRPRAVEALARGVKALLAEFRVKPSLTRPRTPRSRRRRTAR
jgi:AcrR family transcriptional regulator